MRKNKNKGFTLVELIVVISIFTVLLGILEPSVSSIFGFRAQRAANSIASALDRTKTEAMNRLVGEMVLTKESDGFYISYNLHKGKHYGCEQTQAEKIAPANAKIGYTTTDRSDYQDLSDQLIITFNRENGGFRPIQSDIVTTDSVTTALNDKKDVIFYDTGAYCTAIIVKGGSRTYTIEMEKDTGSYAVKAG